MRRVVAAGRALLAQPAPQSLSLPAVHTGPSAPPQTEPAAPNLITFENYGYCVCCQAAVKFEAHGGWLRDTYVCTNCGSLPRERAIMYCIERLFPTWRGLTIHESSPADQGASRRLRSECPGYFASQYFPEVERGSIRDGFRCEDLEQLTLADNSVDLHVTQDVFEHILDPARAFAEIARTLKPGGAHVFTTPLLNKELATFVCARRGPDGRIEHMLPEPEYHENPVSPGGSLVTVHWGYDICEFVHRASGLFTRMIYIDALDLGIRADLIEVLVTVKPGL